LYDHVDVYLDESGDLGFSERSSGCFVIVALATTEPHKLVRVIRKAHRRFSLVDGAASEFKFNRSGERLRQFILGGLVKTDSWFAWGGVVKPCVPQRFRRDREELWQYVAARTMAELSRRTYTKALHVFVERRSLRKVVRRHISERLRWEVENHHGGHFPPDVRISHIDSSMSAGLQVADHVAGAVFCSVERGNPCYVEQIKSKVSYGEMYW